MGNCEIFLEATHTHTRDTFDQITTEQNPFIKISKQNQIFEGFAGSALQQYVIDIYVAQFYSGVSNENFICTHNDIQWFFFLLFSSLFLLHLFFLLRSFLSFILLCFCHNGEHTTQQQLSQEEKEEGRRSARANEDKCKYVICKYHIVY